MKAVIYVLRGGLKHYCPPTGDEQAFYWEPRKKQLFPVGQQLSDFSEYVVVDSNITTTRTVFQTIRDLQLPREKVKIRGNARTKIAEKIIDELVPDGNPDPEKIIIAFAGKAGTMKSFLAKGLEMARGISVIKIGKELQKLQKLEIEIGEYGERLFQREQDNPFIVGEILYSVIQKYKDEKVIIIDGVKTVETMTFIGFATRRPVFLFFVEINERLRELAVDFRSDSDDSFKNEREELFKLGLQELRRQAYSVINMDDWRTFQPFSDLLGLLGFKITEIAGIPNIFGSKQPLLELYKRNVEKLIAKRTKIDCDFSKYIFHRNYLKRLKHLDSKRSDIIALVASAFRIIDDILDEHEIRNNELAFWKQHGISKAIYIATLMTAKAWNISEKIEMSSEFQEMFRKVIEAVRYELAVEDGTEEFRDFSDWLRAAEREAAFREFLAILSGQPEKTEKFRAWALRAQAKDDLLGSTKGSREDTERRLMRPLFSEEWSSEIKKLIEKF